MAAITDGTFTSPLQDGDKQVVFPFDFLGDAYARMITRPYVMLSSSYTAPRTLTTTSVTNLCLRSETFTNAAWTQGATTATDNVAANPNNGASTAATILETVANSQHYLSQTITATAAVTNLSLYLKPNGRSWLAMEYLDSGATARRCFFDVTNGVVGTSSGTTTGTITSVGNGWYRCSISFTPAAGSGIATLYLTTAANTLASYIGDITKGFYIWGAQFTTSATVSTYLPTTSATRTSSLRTLDAADNTGDSAADQFAFLCQETPPDAGSLRQGIARLSRTYMRVPAQQIDYGSAIINRPVLDDVKSGTTYGVSWDDRFSWVFSSRKSVTSFAAPDVPTTANINNGSTPGTLSGSVTISFTGNNSTQTFASNASDATIQNQLSTAVTGGTGAAANFKIVRNVSGITVSVVTTNTTVSAISSDSAAVIVSPLITLGLATGGAATDLFRLEAADANAASIRSVSATGHGGVAGDRVVFWNGDKIVAKGVVITAATDTFTANLDAIPGKDFTATHCGFSTDAAACYVNGPVSVSTKIVTDFYYPGWSPGITTPADITVVSTQLDPISWLGLIVAGTAYGAIETGNVEKYQGGPFYSYTATYAQMSDALDTVTP